ncbi:lipid II:glycine glycyltransferase FemX [Spirochaeta lutea]|uniref:lipid II:glycine glycyltransferase FemX n=1 Tax=Spirochaeta lutea TaxID=1480694 RepID=UPI001EE6B40A|nr:peptidoglycan bridge formation glycyltransferase FemA/FemB family protein [Spirochaeta lutea]
MRSRLSDTFGGWRGIIPGIEEQYRWFSRWACLEVFLCAGDDAGIGAGISEEGSGIGPGSSVDGSVRGPGVPGGGSVRKAGAPGEGDEPGACPDSFSGPNLLQSPLWARHKGRFGWSSRFLVCRWGCGVEHSLLVLVRSMPGGISIGYVPHGPAWSDIQGIIATYRKYLEYQPEEADPEAPGSGSEDSDTLAVRESEMGPGGRKEPDPSGQAAGETEAEFPRWIGLELRELLASESDIGSFILRDLGRAIRSLLPRGCMALRFDPDWPVRLAWGKGDDEKAVCPGLVKGEADIQPPQTIILNLEEDEDTIIARMKTKHRYNIRLSRRKGVVVRRTSAKKDLETWYELYRETALRDGITIHSRDYYTQLFELFSEAPGTGGIQHPGRGSVPGHPEAPGTGGIQRPGRGSAPGHPEAPGTGDSSGNTGTEPPEGKNPGIALYLAEHEGDVLAGIIVVFWNRRATYLYGASSNLKRNLMPAYALQWRAIQDAKAAGCDEYDLFGIPPSPDPEHPMYGLYQFKTGFKGEMVVYPGTWDRVYRPVVYALYRWAEVLRTRMVRLRKKR